VWYIKIENFLFAGIRLPKLNLDPFYITADVFLFQSIFLFTILAFVLLVSRSMADDKSPILPNFAIYFLAYPFVAPLFIFIAVYKFLFKSENKWVLQDNKM
jgi:hypothetical protein